MSAASRQSLRMGSLRSGRGRNGLQVENAEKDNLQAITPGVGSTFEAAIAEHQLQKMSQRQQAASQIDQQVQWTNKRYEQIDQHHQPEQQAQQLPQPPKHLHTLPRRELLFARTITAYTRDKPEGTGKFFRKASNDRRINLDDHPTALSRSS